jgi:formate/nitrite transporter FocA (FNT family)
MHYQISFNALFPPAMVAKGEDLGLKKANTKALNLFLHATSTGVFIGIEQW